MYASLLKTLETLRERTARFRRVTLHLHSPDSWDWAKERGDPAKNNRELLLAPEGTALFLNELNPYFEMVAVTDHMKCGYACRLSEATSGKKDCIVLPGMEVNFKPDAALGSIRIHLIVILPENSTKEHFSKILPASIPSDDNRTGKEDVEGMTLKEFVKNVDSLNGICIAAHVENNQGIRKRFRQTAVETLKLFSDGDEKDLEKNNAIAESLQTYLIESGLHAVEIQSAAKSCHYRWESQKNNSPFWLPTLLTFDAHCVEDLAKKECVTHIKTTHRTMHGLKDALAFPETRIRFPDNLPKLPNPRLLGIQIKGSSGSFFEDITVAFAENLNCIIGVRGSGKSTLVEALRYAFGFNRTLNEVGTELADSIQAMQKKNLSGSSIKVIYVCIDGSIRILETTYDEKEDYATKVYSHAGDFIDVPDVEKSGDYPLRLYGWSEIEILGREPARQRDLLDRLIPEIAPVIVRRKTIRAELRTNRSVIEKHVQQVKNAYDASNTAIRKYKEYKNDFARQNTTEVKGVFAALDLATEKKNLLAQLKTNAEAILGRLIEFDVVNLQSDIDDLLQNGSQELRNWWNTGGATIVNASAVEADVQKNAKQAIVTLKIFISLTNDRIKETDETVAALQNELKKGFSANDSMQKIADLRANADKRLKTVTIIREAYQKQWKQLMDALGQRKDIVLRLEQVQNEIAGIRAKRNGENEQILNDFLPKEMKVTIDFQAGRDTSKFKDVLYKIFSNKSQQLKKIQDVLAALVTPIECARMMCNGDFNQLVGKTIAQGGAKFEANDSATCKERTFPFEQDDSADAMILADGGSRLTTILDVQESPWDDYEAILLNGDPVNKKSPGQRSSAMLPLVALAEKTPLIIDQPEDNLDKRLIGSVLVKVLAELKEHRQIIVCTHDPNILVGGDAEQVVVLEATSDKKGKVVAHGSIDNDDIVATVIDLLEGGREAFESRRKRYK